MPIPPKNMETPKIRFKFSLPKSARGTRAKNRIIKLSGTKSKADSLDHCSKLPRNKH